MRGWRLVGLAGLTLVLSAGCNFYWRGPATVTSKDGTVYRCTSLDSDEFALFCENPDGRMQIAWSRVAGFRTEGAR